MNLQDQIQSIVGSSVTKVVAGGSNGSIFVIYFKNDFLKSSLSVYCAWRLSINSKIVTGNHESPKSKIPQGLRKLKKLHIIEVNISQHYDVNIKLENQYELDVFCNITPNYPNKLYDENWYYIDDIHNVVFTVNKYLELLVERGQKDEG